MKSPKEDEVSDEDIPSDFFDDFNKEEFMEGLSVIDSWDFQEGTQTQSSRSRINAAAIDGVRDLRELIGDSREDRDAEEVKVMQDQNKKGERYKKSSDRYSSNSGRYGHSSQLDNYIKPGSRRDLRKTNEAIKKDKEVKVKEYLSKHLDSAEDLKPPGTELDDFLNESSVSSKRKAKPSPEMRHSRHSSPSNLKLHKTLKRDYHLKDKHMYYNTRQYEYKNQRGHPYFKPYQKYRQQSPNFRMGKNYHQNYLRQSDRTGYSPGPRNMSRRSPLPYSSHGRSPRRHSPREHSSRGHSPRGHSPRGHSPRGHSPRGHSPRGHSPRGHSPRGHSPLGQNPRGHSSRGCSPRGYSPRGHSPRGRSLLRYNLRRHSPHWRSRSRSPRPSKYEYGDKRASLEVKDSFLYPNEMSQIQMPASLLPVSNYEGETRQGEFYSNPPLTKYPVGDPGYTYMQNTSYPCAGYEYGAQTDSMNLGLTQPTPTPIMTATPSMVPPPPDSTSAVPQVTPITLQTSNEEPYDALAKLVVEGKLSKEDYLKLAPNKGTFVEKAVATQVRVKVLDRCIQALAKLSKLEMPNRLFLNNALIDQETKSLTPKYCSPLKRQAPVDFYFTKTNSESETVRQNRQVIDNIISTIGLSDIVLHSKKNSNKNMTDAAVQTTNSFCEVCHIRETTKTYDAETSIDHEDFTATVHTQVVDEDLINSKSVFNPSGGVANHEPISIAHLTPAQLVSQLAARAKTLKQSQPQRPQFNRRIPGSNYEYGGSNNDTFYKKFSNA